MFWIGNTRQYNCECFVKLSVKLKIALNDLE